MNKITKNLVELQRSVPKHVQWLALFAAFLVVLILLFLLMSDSDPKGGAVKTELPVNLVATPGNIEWTDVKIGDAKSERIVLKSENAQRINVSAVKLSAAVPGVTINNTCRIEITNAISCQINISWDAAKVMSQTNATIIVDYNGAGLPDTLMKTIEIPVTLSTVKPAPAPVVAPVVEQPKPVEVPRPAEVVPVTAPAPAPVNPMPVTEDCYQFAFVGYDLDGAEMGWIVPNKGAYMFHPFGDANCSSPVGVYNYETGVITDIKNPAKKIGTDADHIGYTNSAGLTLPKLSNAAPERTAGRARQLSGEELNALQIPTAQNGMNTTFKKLVVNRAADDKYIPSSYGEIIDATVSSQPYDRRFVLRQFKPIPATIVSEVRADTKILSRLPVQATVDRHVYSDNGRTIILPAGTLMLGYATGDLPGPYKTIGRMQINWYRFVRPDGVEFNFNSQIKQPFSADSQGRTGVPGRGSTDYIEQMVMPMLTALVPAAVNLIAPISDRFVNQIDLDNNTVTQSGQVRSSELAKQQIITAWNNVAQKLAIDMLDNTVPPFSIASGTRITVFSPMDLVVAFCEQQKNADGTETESCQLTPAPYATYPTNGNESQDFKPTFTVGESEPWTKVGQVRSAYTCDQNGQNCVFNAALNTQDARAAQLSAQMNQYQSSNQAGYNAYVNQQQQNNAAAGYNSANQIGLTNKDASGNYTNPFATPPKTTTTALAGLTCEDGVTAPDTYGCCPGETYTDMGAQGFNCCPSTGGDCFPPIK